MSKGALEGAQEGVRKAERFLEGPYHEKSATQTRKPLTCVHLQCLCFIFSSKFSVHCILLKILCTLYILLVVSHKR